MTPDEWTFAARLDELDEDSPQSVELDGEEVLLLRRGDYIHACGPRCTHWNYPMERGTAEGNTLTCPWHGARFDAESGEVTGPPALDHIGCYDVKIEDGKVFVGPASGPEVGGRSPGDDRDFVIVGGGAAGVAAATCLRQEGFGGRVRLVTEETEQPYDRTLLSKHFLQGYAPPDWLRLHDQEHYESCEIELLKGSRATGLDPETRELRLESGETLSYDALLCATGGNPIELPIPGTDLGRYYRLRTLEDARRLAEGMEDAEKAVLLGAGFVCLEIATVFRKQDIEVDVVAPEKVLYSPIFGDKIGEWLRRQHEETGITFHLGHTPAEVKGDERVEAVVLDDETVLPADMVVSGVGVKPAVGWLQDSGLAEENCIAVDDRLQTRAEDVYAAGDMAAVPHPLNGRYRRTEHWAEAQQQARHAARMMIGGDAPYRGIPFFWTEQAGVSLKHVGGPVEWDHIEMRGKLEEGDFLAAYYADGELRAACGADRAEEVLACRRLMEADENLPPGRLDAARELAANCR